MKETYLYIKQHEITGLKYFGKTTKNPLKYYGSGTRWLNHIKKHGKEHVKTIWYKLFTDKDELTRTAIAMSEMYDVVDSPFWANLKPENGLDGATIGHTFQLGKNNSMYGKKHSEETKEKIGESRRKYSGELNPFYGKTHSEETKKKQSEIKKGKIASDETRAKMSEKRKGELNPFYGKKHKTAVCPHCGKESGIANMKRWHFDNCKFKEKVK